MSTQNTITVEKTGILDEVSDITTKLEMEQRIDGFAESGRITASLAPLWDILAPHMLDIIEAFFHELLKTGEARKAIDLSRLEVIKKRQVEFWHFMLTAPMNRHWGQVVSERGAYMHRIGLEPRFYLPAYAVIFDHIFSHVSDSLADDREVRRRTLVAVNRLNFLINEIMASTHHEMVREEAAALLDRHGKDFESDVVASIASVAKAAARMRDQAEKVNTAITRMGKDSSSVSDAANQNADNVRTAAAATEELSISLNEMTRQVKRTATASEEAHGAAEAAGEVIVTLSQFSEKIGHVIKLIDDIAGQTNLLALNATIEAARAGEAGRGFAVVANEVKALAGQTAQATKEITNQINAVQATTRNMVDANKRVRGSIGKVTEIADEISSMIDEQASAIGEITRAVNEAAKRTGDVSSTIAKVSQSAGDVGGAMTELRGDSGEVASLTETLSEKVGGFLRRIRA